MPRAYIARAKLEQNRPAKPPEVKNQYVKCLLSAPDTETSIWLTVAKTIQESQTWDLTEHPIDGGSKTVIDHKVRKPTQLTLEISLMDEVEVVKSNSETTVNMLKTWQQKSQEIITLGGENNLLQLQTPDKTIGNLQITSYSTTKDHAISNGVRATLQLKQVLLAQSSFEITTRAEPNKSETKKPRPNKTKKSKGNKTKKPSNSEVDKALR